MNEDPQSLRSLAYHRIDLFNVPCYSSTHGNLNSGKEGFGKCTNLVTYDENFKMTWHNIFLDPIRTEENANSEEAS